MEDIVEFFIKDMCQPEKYNYIREAKQKNKTRVGI